MILGITGNIACGKSLVAELLRQKGAALLSADQLAREVVAPGSALLAELVDQFGEQILTPARELDRERLARQVFADADVRRKLNALLHPAIGALADERLARLAQSDVPLVVYEAPLLFEAGAEQRVDRVLVVTIAPDIQRQRLVARDRLLPEEAERRISAQMAQQEKAARADYLIDNSGTIADLEQKVAHLWTELVGCSRPQETT